MNDKRGVSPLIASILLVALVIVIAFLIFWWYGELIAENVEKSQVDAEQVCLSDVSFSVSNGRCISSTIGGYNILAFEVSNNGDVKLASFRVTVSSNNQTDTKEIAQAIQQGIKVKLSTLVPDSFSGDLNVKIVPMIRAGGTTRHCVEKSQEIVINC